MHLGFLFKLRAGFISFVIGVFVARVLVHVAFFLSNSIPFSCL